MEIRIVNVLEIVEGIPTNLESFLIFEDQFSEKVVEQAEKLFKKLICKNSSIDIKNEDILEKYVEEGIFENLNGYKVCLMWSN